MVAKKKVKGPVLKHNVKQINDFEWGCSCGAKFTSEEAANIHHDNANVQDRRIPRSGTGGNSSWMG